MLATFSPSRLGKRASQNIYPTSVKRCEQEIRRYSPESTKFSVSVHEEKKKKQLAT